MTSSPSPAAAPISSEQRRKTKLWTHKMRLWTLCLVLPAVVLMAAGVYFVSANWPYRYRTVEPMLQEVFASQVKIGHYHRIYFPNPGFMATEITLSRNSAPNLPPLGSARSLTVQGTWLDLLLLRERVRLVDITGLHIVLPALGSSASHEDFPAGSSADFGGPTAVVEQLRIHESILDIMRANGSRYSFPIRQLVIRNLQKGQALAYAVDMQNAKPTGHILSTGSFGPLNPKNLGATPLSGNFTFSRVNLRDIGNIGGTLSSTGHFNGTLAAFEADAVSETPDFAVGNGEPTPFATSVHCGINGLNGDVILHGIDAKTGASTIHVEGGIVGSPKVINVEMSVAGGRMQDLLRPLIHDKVPLAGAVWLHSHAQLDPAGNGSKFLQRLRVDGTFDAPAERLTNQATEQKLSAFSQRAQGVKPSKLDPSSAGQASNASADVVSSFKGQAKIRDGVLSTQRIIVQMPGVEVDLGGSFNLRNSTVDLTGNIRMQSDISHTATGFKSALMKPLIPFFKKKNAGAVIPIAVTGGPGGYKVTQNLLHRK
jgi:AsmA-like C-terminal region